LTKSFRCRDAGVVCRATITGETEEEVLEQAIDHGRAVHGVDLADSRTLARHARTLIRDDGRPAAAEERS